MSTLASSSTFQPIDIDSTAEPKPATSGSRLRPAILASLFICLMFMLATNDPAATGRFQEQGRDKIQDLWVRVEEGRAVRQVGLLLMGAWGVAALLWPAARPTRLRLTRPLAFPLTLLLGWASISILWSTDRSFTMKRLVVLSCLTAAVLAFARRFRARDIMMLAFVGGCVQLGADVIADALWRVAAYTDSDYRLSGLQHPNHTGIASALVLLSGVAVWDKTRRRAILVVLAAAFLALLMTKSRSSLFACAAAMSVLAALRLSVRQLVSLTLVGSIVGSVALIVAAAGALPDGLDTIVHMGRTDTGKVALTGRPMVWAAVFEVVGPDRTRLLTGAGYDSFWTPSTAQFVSSRVWFGISEGHNAYLDMLLELGVVGSGCFAACLLVGCGRWALLARRHDAPSYAFCAAICAFAIVHGLTESTMSDPNFATFVLFTSLASLAFRAPRLADEPTVSEVTV